jgi:hypothetical protein
VATIADVADRKLPLQEIRLFTADRAFAWDFLALDLEPAVFTSSTRCRTIARSTLILLASQSMSAHLSARHSLILTPKPRHNRAIVRNGSGSSETGKSHHSPRSQCPSAGKTFSLWAARPCLHCPDGIHHLSAGCSKRRFARRSGVGFNSPDTLIEKLCS